LTSTVVGLVARGRRRVILYPVSRRFRYRCVVGWLSAVSRARSAWLSSLPVRCAASIRRPVPL
jgi:hypothetical protein